MNSIIILDSRPLVAEALAELLAEAGEVNLCRTLDDVEITAAWAEEKPLLVVAPTLAIAHQARLREIGDHFLSIVLLVENSSGRRLPDFETCVSLESEPVNILSAVRIILSGAQVQMARSPSKNEQLLKLLTAREREILELLGQAYSNKAVANALGISSSTVAVHLRTMFVKLGIRNRTQAAMLLHEYAGPSQPLLSFAA